MLVYNGYGNHTPQTKWLNNKNVVPAVLGAVVKIKELAVLFSFIFLSLACILFLGCYLLL